MPALKLLSVADTTTDCENIEDELYMVMHFDPHSQDGAVNHIALKLALKDAQRNIVPTINEMLLLLYYCTTKSPKKCNELNEVAASLKLCQQLVDIDRFVPVEHDLCTIKFQQLALQEDELCVVSAVEAILKAIENIRTAAFEDLPTVKRVLARVDIDENGTHNYQGVGIVKYDQAVQF
eukprot:Em0007g1338a